MESKNDVILRQANAITESRYDFNPIEKRVLYKIIERVRRDYVEGSVQGNLFHDIEVKMNLNQLSEVDEKNPKRVREALISLRKRDIEIVNEAGDWMNTGFIRLSKIKKDGTVSVQVSGEIMPYLVELAKNFTAYSLTVAISLKSKYSQRMYELCCQYRKVGFFTKNIEQLRKMFCLENSYPQVQDFKRYVLKTAEVELKKAYEQVSIRDGKECRQCDLWFEYTQKGRGDKASFTFCIHTPEGDKAREEAFEDLAKMSSYVYLIIGKAMKTDKKYAARVKEYLDLHPDVIRPVFDKLTKLQKDFEGAAFAKMVRWILREDFGIK